jgi:uncharacterized membrane protein
MATDTGKPARIASVDVVRGLIMILMALDHVRDFVGVPGRNPTDLATTTVPLFFTRWITHFCAPVFFLLTGTGAYLSLARKTRKQLSFFLVTRGFWLLFLEAVVVRCLGWQFNFDYHLTILNVLWALGWSMIVLSALVYLPPALVSACGLILIAGHNLFDSVESDNPLWSILHVPAILLNTPQHIVLVAYPLIPWIGVTAAGFGLGQIYNWSPERRRNFLIRAALVAIAAFCVLRAINRYGDPAPWAKQKSAIFTALSFINTTKYPPSLLFLLMTLGPALVFLFAVDGHIPQLLRPALVFGKVPMFYYLSHIPLIHVIAIIICFAQNGAIHWMFESSNPSQFPVTPPPGWGLNLPGIYCVWTIVVLILYPLCRRFAALKERSRALWLSYF